MFAWLVCARQQRSQAGQLSRMFKPDLPKVMLEQARKRVLIIGDISVGDL
jgi:hypothetical protein